MDRIEQRRTTPGWRRFVNTPARDRRTPAPPPERRVVRRHTVSLRAAVSTIDPVRDRHTGELYYDTSEHEQVLEISRRGLRLRTDRPPEDGTRVLLRLRGPGPDGPGSDAPGDEDIDLVARTRWSHPEFVPGECGARATAVVGLEIIGGPARSLDAFERWLTRTPTGSSRGSVARPQALV